MALLITCIVPRSVRGAHQVNLRVGIGGKRVLGPKSRRCVCRAALVVGWRAFVEQFIVSGSQHEVVKCQQGAPVQVLAASHRCRRHGVHAVEFWSFDDS